MRILIMGICGFIGSHLAEAYDEAGHEVYGIDNLTTGRRENYDGAWDELDICERHKLYALANEIRPELVVHCAASYSDPNLWHRDTDTNVMGAINVSAVARHHDCPIIYFQTVLPPISSYAISKIAGEHYLRLSGQPLTVFRLASVYGPRNLSGPIPTFYKRIKAGETCTAVSNTTRDFVYIGDLVERVLDGMPGTYDIRSGIETRIDVLPHIIGQRLGVEPTVEVVPRPADDVQAYDMSGPPLSQPTHIVDGIAETVDWYLEHGVGDTYTHLAMKG